MLEIAGFWEKGNFYYSKSSDTVILPLRQTFEQVKNDKMLRKRILIAI